MSLPYCNFQVSFLFPLLKKVRVFFLMFLLLRNIVIDFNHVLSKICVITNWFAPAAFYVFHDMYWFIWFLYAHVTSSSPDCRGLQWIYSPLFLVTSLLVYVIRLHFGLCDFIVILYFFHNLYHVIQVQLFSWV